MTKRMGSFHTFFRRALQNKMIAQNLSGVILINQFDIFSELI
jgi:hypothetical protein